MLFLKKCLNLKQPNIYIYIYIYILIGTNIGVHLFPQFFFLKKKNLKNLIYST